MTFWTLLRRRLLVGSAAILGPAELSAQDAPIARDSAGPRAGSWAAELGIGSGQSAMLLRFRTPTSAMLLGVDAFWLDVSEEGSVTGGGGTQENRQTFASVAARVGFRQYRGTALALRPFTSFGILAGYTSDGGGPGWTAGAFGELGASYFFTPHVSLGASGGLQVIYTRQRRQFAVGSPITSRSLGIRGSAVQLLGAVYF